MKNVRKIYTILFILGIFSFFGFYYFYNFNKIKTFAKINILILSLLTLILPFFVYFWDNIFHIILFNNNAWITTPTDISYYLFSYQFFKNSLIFLIVNSIAINLGILFILKYKKKTSISI